MLTAVSIGCVSASTIALIHYLTTKTRLAEKMIDQAIMRRLSSSTVMTELARTRDNNAVMRNLLIDLVENETSTAARMIDATLAEQKRHARLRIQRYKEILSEAAYVIQRSGGTETKSEHQKVRVTGNSGPGDRGDRSRI